MDFLQLMQERYTAKYYDSSKVVPQDILDKIIECARLTPTSVNSQPYHFYVASGEAKARLRPTIKDFNLQRYDSASHVIIVSSLTRPNDDQLNKVLEAEERDGRLPTPEIKQTTGEFRSFCEKSHFEQGTFLNWTGKQAYIAFGTLLYAAQAYGVDSTPVEGFEYPQLDELLGLPAKGETCQYMVLLGYRDADDSNVLSKRPKSRLATADLVTVL